MSAIFQPQPATLAGCLSLSLSLSLQPSPATRKPSGHVQLRHRRTLTPAIPLVRQPCGQRHPSPTSAQPATRTHVRLHRHHPSQTRPPRGLGAARSGTAVRCDDQRECLHHPQPSTTLGSYPVGLRVTEHCFDSERAGEVALGGGARPCRSSLQECLHLPHSKQGHARPPPDSVGGAKRRTGHARLPPWGGRQSRSQPALAPPRPSGGSRGDRGRARPEPARLRLPHAPRLASLGPPQAGEGVQPRAPRVAGIVPSESGSAPCSSRQRHRPATP